MGEGDVEELMDTVSYEGSFTEITELLKISQ